MLFTIGTSSRLMFLSDISRTLTLFNLKFFFYWQLGVFSCPPKINTISTLQVDGFVLH